MLLGISSEYELMEQIQDYKTGVFAFTIKCILYKNNSKITEGVGCCSTKESKYAYKWVYEKEIPVTLNKEELVQIFHKINSIISTTKDTYEQMLQCLNKSMESMSMQV
jgi:hypothetical protein